MSATRIGSMSRFIDGLLGYTNFNSANTSRIRRRTADRVRSLVDRFRLKVLENTAIGYQKDSVSLDGCVLRNVDVLTAVVNNNYAAACIITNRAWLKNHSRVGRPRRDDGGGKVDIGVRAHQATGQTNCN